MGKSVSPLGVTLLMIAAALAAAAIAYELKEGETDG